MFKKLNEIKPTKIPCYDWTDKSWLK